MACGRFDPPYRSPAQRGFGFRIDVVEAKRTHAGAIEHILIEVAGPDQHAERRNARQHLFLLIFGRWRFGFLDARALWRELRPAQPQQCAIRERTFDAHTAEYRLGRTALLSLQELPAQR